MSDAADCDLLFLHALKHRRLRLRRRAINLVRENDVGEHRPGQKLECTRTCRLVLGDDFRARDIARHQVGRELYAAELQRHRPRQRRDHHRFRQTGNTFENAVAAGEQRDQELLDHVILTDDHFVQLVAQSTIRLCKSTGGGDVVTRGIH